MDQCPQRPRERILNPSTQVTVGSKSDLVLQFENYPAESPHFEKKVRAAVVER